MVSICRMTKSGFLLFSVLLFSLTGCQHTPDAPDSVARPAPSIAIQSPSPAQSDTDTSFEMAKVRFIEEFSDKYSFDRTRLTALFEQVHRNPTVIRLVTPSGNPKAKNWQNYRKNVIDPARISAGVRFWNQYEDAIDRATQTYGVPSDIIVAIIGIESVYGRYTGNFRIIDALSTLAFDYPETPNQASRKRFFRKELENLLLLAKETGTNPADLYGSYAGAIGYPQFMPGSIRQFAVDFDGDGTIDLENSPVDAIGSIAHFLVRHGWKAGLPIAFPVQTQPDCTIPSSLLDQGLAATLSLSRLENGCIIPKENVPADILFGLIDLPNGTAPADYWIGTDNFFAITHYNRSYFYAMSVVLLAQEIANARNGQ